MAFIRFRRIFVLAVLEVFVLIGIFGYSYILRQYNKIQRPTFEVKNVENTELSVEVIQKMKGYWNIAAFGVDSRDSSVGRGNNSDVIMVVSINRENGDIRIASVFRDSYLSLSNGMYSKINAAYAIGGPEQAVKALNQNLDLNITDYITFNWKAVATGVNILGGVDLELTNAEFKYINSYITETVKGTGIGSEHLEHAGMNHLDGIQAVAYARLRYMDDDYTRTARQRKIIQLCVDKAKKADAQTLSDLAGNMLSMVATSLTWEDGMSLATNVKKYNIAETLGFPMHRKESIMGPKGACVLPATLEKNVKELHTFLFGDQEYEVSKQVKEIDWKIATDEQNYKARAAASKEEELEKQRKEKEKETEEDEENESGAPGETISGRKIVFETDADGKRIITEVDEDGNKIFYETNASGKRVAYETDEDGEKIYLEEDDEPGEFETDPSGRPYNSGRVTGGLSPSESAAASTENFTSPGGQTLPTAPGVPGGAGTSGSGGSISPGSGGSTTTPARPSAPGETTDGYVYEGPGHSGNNNSGSGSGSGSGNSGSSGSLTPAQSTTAATAAAVPGGSGSSSGSGSPGGSGNSGGSDGPAAPVAPSTTEAAPAAPAPAAAAPAPTTAAPQETAAAGPGASMMVDAVPN
ncbi:MAG: LCP family protein [Stomatobaculum sp.]|nr:LCP family protein [Stomatobaculum sp.]